MEWGYGYGAGSGEKGEICGYEVLVSSHNRLGRPHCGEMRWLIYRYSHRKERKGRERTSKQVPSSHPRLLGNSYAKHGRWIARLVTLLRTLSLSLSRSLSTLQHRSWAGHPCHEVDTRRGHGAMATTSVRPKQIFYRNTENRNSPFQKTKIRPKQNIPPK